MIPRPAVAAVLAAASLLALGASARGAAAAGAPAPTEQAEPERDLRTRVANGRDEDLSRPDFGAQRADVLSYYTSIDWSRRWLDHGVPTPQARALVARFVHAAERGLRSADYDGPRWAARLAALARRQLSGGDAQAENDFDLAVTVAALRYASDVHRGRVDPRSLGFPLPPKPLDGPALLQSLAAAPDAGAMIDALEPRFAAYRRLRDALPRALALVPLPQPRLTATLRPGDRSDATDALAAELVRLGDLPVGARWTTGIYDGALAAAVRHFQDRHGLDPDGVLGRSTLAALAVPRAQRVQQIVLTLERWRWLPDDLSGSLILVNIPEFRLRALRIEGDELLADLSLRVVVGDSYDHQTPALVASLQQLIFHPAWNVPARIAREELLPEIRRDPGYLAAHDYELLAGAGPGTTALPATPENLDRLERGNVVLRQRPGPQNALGVVKFVFPNRDDVYLHDTPGRSAFRAPRRDLSHGCVRVEDALSLARWVLRGQPEGSPDGLRALLDADATRQVGVRRPVTVLLLYGTVFVARDGELHFFADLYGHDRALARALASAAAGG